VLGNILVPGFGRDCQADEIEISRGEQAPPSAGRLIVRGFWRSLEQGGQEQEERDGNVRATANRRKEMKRGDEEPKSLNVSKYLFTQHFSPPKRTHLKKETLVRIEAGRKNRWGNRTAKAGQL